MPYLECISLDRMCGSPIPKETALCLGNFDGVHLAHRALLRDAVEWRNRAFPHIPIGVFCFREPPARYLLPDPPGQLCSLEERLRRFAECGVEFAILADFNELRNLPAADYLRDILQVACGCRYVACGFNHRFGRGGQGSPTLLREVFGEALLVREAFTVGGLPVSSTRIRAALSEGRAQEVEGLLGEPYALTAEVLHGKALGRRLGAPTLNQRFPQNAVLPRFGVYVSDVWVGDTRYIGVSNIGVHPTVDFEGAVNCETYLLDFEGDLYGQRVKVAFRHFLREEQQFLNVAALQAQIGRDIAAARSWSEKNKTI